MAHINTREHRATKRKPAAMLTEEVLRLHRISDDAHTVSLGLARTVPPNTPMVTCNNALYPVPSHLLGQEVFARSHCAGPDEKVVIVHHTPAGPVEVARHSRARPGSPAINDEHFPGYVEKIPGDYTPRVRTAAEGEFLAIGGGALTELKEVAAVDTSRMNIEMAEAVSLAKIDGVIDVDRALGTPAIYGRFAHGDLSSIFQAGRASTTTHAASEDTSLTQGTSAWAAITSTTATVS